MSSLQLNPITGGPQSVASSAIGIENVLSVAFGFLTIAGGITFVVWLIVGAYSWMTAEGKPDKLEKARNHITQAVTGLIILIGAYAITAVVGSILGLNIFDLQGLLNELK